MQDVQGADTGCSDGVQAHSAQISTYGPQRAEMENSN